MTAILKYDFSFLWAEISWLFLLHYQLLENQKNLLSQYTTQGLDLVSIIINNTRTQSSMIIRPKPKKLHKNLLIGVLFTLKIVTIYCDIAISPSPL